MSDKEVIRERFIYPHQCPGCGRCLNARAFESKGVYRGRRYRENYCTDCRKFFKQFRRVVREDADDKRQCNRCLNTQYITEFDPCGTELEYRRRVCKTCERPRKRRTRRIYYALNRERILAYGRVYRMERKRAAFNRTLRLSVHD